MKIPDWIRSRFPADQRAAVDFLRVLVDKGMLREIAEADHDQDADEHMAALLPIWEGGKLGPMDYWYPQEVLELTRWSEPTSADMRGHQIRAVSCAVLLAVPGIEPDKNTLIQMLDSVVAIGEGAKEAAGRFLVWRMESLEHEESRPFFVLALVALTRFLNPDMPFDQTAELAGWLGDEEAAERKYLSQFIRDYETAPWLFGLSYGDIKDDRWRILIEKIKAHCADGPLGKLLLEKGV